MNRKFLMLIQREFWESKALWMVPVAVAILIIGAATFGQLGMRSGDSISVSASTADIGQRIGAVSLMGIVVVLFVVTGFAVFTFLLDCLLAERRDRSILFWKSLPVSDAQTVLAKLATAMVVMPLGTMLLAMLTQPVVALITWVRFEELRPLIDFGLFAAWPATLARLGGIWIFSTLWFAPLALYLMLASVLAKRAPILYAALPPLVLILGERQLLGSRVITDFLADRLFPWPSRMQHLMGSLQPPLGGDPRITGIEPNWWIPFQDPNLWIGLAVAAGMLYIVIRLRRYRDDT